MFEKHRAKAQDFSLLQANKEGTGITMHERGGSVACPALFRRYLFMLKSPGKVWEAHFCGVSSAAATCPSSAQGLFRLGRYEPQIPDSCKRVIFMPISESIQLSPDTFRSTGIDGRSEPELSERYISAESIAVISSLIHYRIESRINMLASFCRSFSISAINSSEN